MKTTLCTCRGFEASFDEELRVLIVRLTDERLIDGSLITDMEQDIDHLLRELSPDVLIIDFSQVAIFSSEIISLVLNLRRALMDRQGTLTLTGLRPIVAEVFRLLNLEGSVVRVCKSIADALDDHNH